MVHQMRLVANNFTLAATRRSWCDRDHATRTFPGLPHKRPSKAACVPAQAREDEVQVSPFHFQCPVEVVSTMGRRRKTEILRKSWWTPATVGRESTCPASGGRHLNVTRTSGCAASRGLSPCCRRAIGSDSCQGRSPERCPRCGGWRRREAWLGVAFRVAFHVVVRVAIPVAFRVAVRVA